MAISRSKFETYYQIRKNYSLYVKDRKDLKDDTIIRVAKEEYGIEITKEDLEEINKNFESLIWKYIN